MILIYRSDKSIHQVISGYGVVTTGTSGTLLIDGMDTTTCAADVSWKYIEDQILERDADGMFLRDAEYYTEITVLTAEQRMDALELSFLESILIG